MSVPHFDFSDEHGLAPIPGADSPPLHTGDPNSKDWKVIDSLVESHAQPPTADELPIENDPKPDPPDIAATRAITGSVVFPATASQLWDAFQVLPADPKRKSLRFTVQSATATDYIRVADDVGKLFADTSSFLVGPGGQGSIDFAHTGPVWVKLAAPSVGPVTVSWFAVTTG